MRHVTSVHFSRRVDISQPNPIIAAQNSAKRKGIALYQLNDSNPTHHGLAPISVPQQYNADPKGPVAAREALAQFLSARAQGSDAEREVQGRPADTVEITTETGTSLTFGAHGEANAVDPARVYLTSSTSQAYSWLMKLLCDPGEAVLCPTPGYPLIESIGRLEGVTAVTYPLRYDGSWTIDVPDIERTLERNQEESSEPQIRALILINPNNPTGSYVGEQDYERLVTLCERFGMAIIADEVFFDFPLLPLETPHRVAGESRVLTFGLDGFSKMLAAPHAKVGWIQVSGPGGDVADALRRLDVIADDFLPMSGIIAEQIPRMLAEVPAQLLRIRERTRTNLVTLEAALAGSSSGVVSLLQPEGGWNVLLRFPSVIDENELVGALIRDHATTAQPGYFFDMVSNGYVAVSLLPEPEEFRGGITTLLETVDALLAV
ncbi:MAG: pyridoxal phosphate-dependent aminotransferase [Bifidobacteriaceae bacterium]|nr:pyridoxal phosphate-dependent aminotransferase [Bifidobacteriaceae bacterium]